MRCLYKSALVRLRALRMEGWTAVDANYSTVSYYVACSNTTTSSLTIIRRPRLPLSNNASKSCHVHVHFPVSYGWATAGSRPPSSPNARPALRGFHYMYLCYLTVLSIPLFYGAHLYHFEHHLTFVSIAVAKIITAHHDLVPHSYRISPTTASSPPPPRPRRWSGAWPIIIARTRNLGIHWTSTSPTAKLTIDTHSVTSWIPGVR